MSILGAVVRVLPRHLDEVVAQLAALPGTDVALNPGDGRLVLVMEDAEVQGAVHTAASTLTQIATWPKVLSTSLVYEYSGPDAPSFDDAGLSSFQDWRGSPKRHADAGNNDSLSPNSIAITRKSVEPTCTDI